MGLCPIAHGSAGGLDDPAGELEQVQPDRGELGAGQRVRAWHAVAQAQQQPVGGPYGTARRAIPCGTGSTALLSMEHQADLVGER